MPAPIAPLRIVSYTATSAAGAGKAALLAALRTGTSALTPNDFGPAPLATWIGRVAGLESQPLPAPLADWECRNNRLAWLGLHGDGFVDAVHAARARHGAARIAVVLGTSTSSIGATEDAYRALDGDGAFPAGNRNPRVHSITVRFTLSDRKINFKYLDSVNMDYKVDRHGNPVIHRKYAGWMNNVATALNREFQMAMLEKAH